MIDEITLYLLTEDMRRAARELAAQHAAEPGMTRSAHIVDESAGPSGAHFRLVVEDETGAVVGRYVVSVDRLPRREGG